MWVEVGAGEFDKIFLLAYYNSIQSVREVPRLVCMTDYLFYSVC